MAALLFTAWLSPACAMGGDGDPRSRMDAAIDGAVLLDADETDAFGIDAAPECEGTEAASCTSACGSEGVRRCTSGRWTECLAPFEACDGVDQDCDGRTDESVAPRSCSSGCGGGSETCVGGAWTGCTAVDPVAETCNNMDDDCDSRIDETLSRACSTACGSGTETCLLGSFSGCTAPPVRVETCNAVDDDCNGAVDDGITRACSSACGSGTETCSTGAFVGCTAPAVPAESCNRLDDDCDGVVDDGFQVNPFASVAQSALTASQAACVSSTSGLDVCLTAAHRWCGMQGCYDSGVGLLGAGSGSARVLCLGPRAVTVVPTTFAEVSSGAAIAITPSNVSTRVALSASNRFCRSRGFEGGYGPVEHGDPVFYAGCVSAPSASYRSIATSELRARGCDPIITAEPVACAAAADGYCRDNGFEGGWGPVEWNDTNAAVVCARD
jgi:hypothetical protein